MDVNEDVDGITVTKDNDGKDVVTLATGLYEDIVYTDKVITDMAKVVADEKTFDKCEDYTIEPYAKDVKVTQKGSVVTFQDDDATTGNGCREGWLSNIYFIGS